MELVLGGFWARLLGLIPVAVISLAATKYFMGSSPAFFLGVLVILAFLFVPPLNRGRLPSVKHWRRLNRLAGANVLWLLLSAALLLLTPGLSNFRGVILLPLVRVLFNGKATLKFRGDISTLIVFATGVVSWFIYWQSFPDLALLPYLISFELALLGSRVASMFSTGAIFDSPQFTGEDPLFAGKGPLFADEDKR